MPLSRLLTIILGISAIVGSIIWLIAAIGGLYSQIAWTSPMLANLLILLIIVLLAVLIGVFYYYFVLEPDKTKSKKNGRRKPRIKIPEQKAQAAAENLKAVRKQVGQIQDRVAKQALLNRSKEIQQNLAKGNLRIVVFGTGSAG
ncbi:MAG: GTP-binding protein, partial [Xenococcaceae cyanobacterium]